MHKYTFPVSGGSPGFKGQIIVVADALFHASQLARAELARMNRMREYHDLGPVELDTHDIGIEVVVIPGVVYSYDGEA
tara:strand:- start:150 stop:383 length:234 start_codon:yes stop_codon:yes gene_type:complete